MHSLRGRETAQTGAGEPDAGLQMRRVIVPTESPMFPLRLVEASL